jgi:hypothetical protein
MALISFSDTCEFRPYLPMENQISPGSYGFELVHYLSQALAKQGIFTSYPFCLPDHKLCGGSDWFIEYKYKRDSSVHEEDAFFSKIHEDAIFLIGVCSECNDEDAYSDETATNIRWHIEIEDALPPRLLSTGADYRFIKNKLAKIIVDILHTRGIKCECKWD